MAFCNCHFYLSLHTIAFFSCFCKKKKKSGHIVLLFFILSFFSFQQFYTIHASSHRRCRLVDVNVKVIKTEKSPAPIIFSSSNSIYCFGRPLKWEIIIRYRLHNLSPRIVRFDLGARSCPSQPDSPSGSAEWNVQSELCGTVENCGSLDVTWAIHTNDHLVRRHVSRRRAHAPDLQMTLPMNSTGTWPLRPLHPLLFAQTSDLIWPQLTLTDHNGP